MKVSIDHKNHKNKKIKYKMKQTSSLSLLLTLKKDPILYKWVIKGKSESDKKCILFNTCVFSFT